MYKAKQYIGGKFRPGDIVPDDFPNIDWLHKAGAIEEITPALQLEEKPETPEVVEESIADSLADIAAEDVIIMADPEEPEASEAPDFPRAPVYLQIAMP